MKVKCPSCFAEYDMGLLFDSEAIRELQAIMANLDRSVSRPLYAYLTLFRSASRSLSHDRALKLAQEVLSLDSNHQRLGIGLSKAVESLREKQVQGDWRPLTNHNYLKRTLENVQILPAQQNHGPAPQKGAPPEQPMKPASKTGQAMLKLEGMKRANRRAY